MSRWGGPGGRGRRQPVCGGSAPCCLKSLSVDASSTSSWERELERSCFVFVFLFIYFFFFYFFFTFLHIHILVTLFVFKPPGGFCLKSSSSVSGWSLTDSDGLLDFWTFAAKMWRKGILFSFSFWPLSSCVVILFPLSWRELVVCDVYSLTHSFFSLTSPPRKAKKSSIFKIFSCAAVERRCSDTFPGALKYGESSGCQGHFSHFHTKKKTLQLQSTFVCPLNFRRRHCAYFYFTPHYWKKTTKPHIFRVSPVCNVRRAKVQLNLSELQLCGAEQKLSKFHTAASQVVSVSAAFFSLT